MNKKEIEVSIQLEQIVSKSREVNQMLLKLEKKLLKQSVKNAMLNPNRGEVNENK